MKQIKRDIDSFYQSLSVEIQKEIESCKSILLPDINLSKRCTSLEDDSIRLGFDIISYISNETIENIISIREKGPFVSILDFLLRIPYIHRKTSDLKMLIQSGCFDSIIHSRLSVLLTMEDMNFLKQLDAFWLKTSQESLGINESKSSIDVSSFLLSNQDDPLRIEDPLPTLMEMEYRALRFHRFNIRTYPYKKVLDLLEELNSTVMSFANNKNQYFIGIVKRIKERAILVGNTQKKLILNITLETEIGLIDCRYVVDKTSFKQSGIIEDSLVIIKISHLSKKHDVVRAECIALLPPAIEMIETIGVNSRNVLSLSCLSSVFNHTETRIENDATFFSH